MSTLILYVFHEYNPRVQFFLDHGLFDHPDYKFLIICNNPSLTFSVPPYVEVLYRENKGFDFGGWSDALLTNDRWRSYDRFVFINSSVIGPFTLSKEPWPEQLLGMLTDTVRLVGPTINSQTYNWHPYNKWVRPHVQSPVFAMARDTLAFLIEKGIFSSQYDTDFYLTILDREVRMSRELIDAGWNIGSLMKCYQGRDFCRPPNPGETEHADINHSNLIPSFFASPYDALFIKSRRWTGLDWLLPALRSPLPSKHSEDAKRCD